MYIGMTKNSLEYRWSGHKYAAKLGKKSPLYDAMRKYGNDIFIMLTIGEYDNKKDCCQAEIDTIANCRLVGNKLYNLANGGEGGYVVPEHLKDEWKAKLSKARQGRKPALGMKHTEKNKKFFAECNKRKVFTYPNLDFSLGFTKNNKLYGISKTHYYRLLKRTNSNEVS
jgi:hypothetical protein